MLSKCFFLLVVMLSINGSFALNRCIVSHKWTLQNFSFPKDLSNSDVKLVAFLKASCGFCRTQAIRYCNSTIFYVFFFFTIFNLIKG